MEFVNGLKANTSKGTVGVILSMLENLPKGKVLDAPAGAGAISRLLAKKGHDVVAFEMDEGEFAAQEVTLIMGDMNQPLPFRNDSFDYIVCIDGIEHLENPYFTIRELARILKPGGELFISTPNISAFRSRARYFFTGFHNKGKTPIAEQKPSPLHHINLMTFPEIRYGLHRFGLRLNGINMNRIKLAAWPYLLLYPFVAIFTLFAFRHEKDSIQRQLNKEIFHQMLSWPVAMGETLILSARKQ
jgi:SAM-dependent methyltransferase